MPDQKMENLLNASLQASNAERERSEQLRVGYDSVKREWEVIVRYTGDISYLQEKYENIKIVPLLNGYAVLTIPENQVEALANEPVIDYMEKPKRLYFQVTVGESISCIREVKQRAQGSPNLSGEGVLVAIIDTGISIFDKDFQHADGTTRIVSLYDQSADVELTQSDINELLAQQRQGVSVVQNVGNDIAGHGSKVARIACGNDGVADKAEIIVVKLAVAQKDSFPRTTQLMRALDFVIRKSVALQKPVAINLSLGNNYGDHTGTSLLENYINALADTYRCLICVGSGNEGFGTTHAGGKLNDSEIVDVEVAISSFETGISLQIWKDYWDDFEVEIITPSGNNLGRISKASSLQTLRTGNVKILTYYGEPSPFRVRQEIYLDMIPTVDYLPEGIWIIRLIPQSIKNGRYDMWLPALSSLNFGTGFTSPDSSLTITIPATAARVMSVGAYDARTRTPALFSGRGFVTEIGGSVMAKPDITAPGVNIRLNSNLSETISGTSYATPFVTGAAALLMEWGMVRGNDLYLYGEKLKSYLIKGAIPFADGENYPNAQTGWGKLCLSASLPLN